MGNLINLMQNGHLFTNTLAVNKAIEEENNLVN